MARTDTKTKAAPHPVDEIMPVGQMTVYALQHVCRRRSRSPDHRQCAGPDRGRVDLPGLGRSIPFRCRHAHPDHRLLEIGARQPIVQGTSFAAVSTMLAIGTAEGGLEG
ncbi:MAG: hypothetical protein WBG76_15355, partial [Ornithinimicrobium sp.]